MAKKEFKKPTSSRSHSSHSPKGKMSKGKPAKDKSSKEKITKVVALKGKPESGKSIGKGPNNKGAAKLADKVGKGQPKSAGKSQGKLGVGKGSPQAKPAPHKAGVGAKAKPSLSPRITGKGSEKVIEKAAKKSALTAKLSGSHSAHREDRPGKKVGESKYQIEKKAPSGIAGAEKMKPKGRVAQGEDTEPKNQQKGLKDKIVKTEKVEAKALGSESEEKSALVAKGRKPTKGKKAEESDIDDVGFLADEIGEDEIGEYAEELQAVEELDSEPEDVESWSQDSREKKEEQEVVLTDAEGRRYCRSRDCDQIEAVEGYCRFHYLLFWKKIQIRKKILADGKLQRYVEELTARYPDKFLELIRRDLRTEKDFLAAIQEMEIDEAAMENEFEEDNSSFIEEVRTMGESAGNSMDEDDY